MLLDINSHSDEEHNLSPSQRAALLAISVGLVMMAGLMSGLTLGLMSMDLVELEVLKRSGTTTEQMYASAITPIVSNQVCSCFSMFLQKRSVPTLLMPYCSGDVIQHSSVTSPAFLL